MWYLRTQFTTNCTRFTQRFGVENAKVKHFCVPVAVGDDRKTLRIVDRIEQDF